MKITMKKHLLILLTALLSTAPLLAQYSPCYEAAFAEGKKAFNAGNYAKAKKYFNEAKNCPDPNTAVINEWIGKCETMIRKLEDTPPENPNAEKENLKAEIEAIKESLEKLDKVFTNAEAQIHEVYEVYQNESWYDIEADELQKALDVYQGIVSLIPYHPLSPGIQEEVEQITVWKNLKVAIDEAIKYMKGKYNNTTRNACISKLDNIKNLSGKQLLDEKNTVLQALKDQAQVNAKFNELLDYLKNEFIVISDKKDAQDALKLIDGKTLVNGDNSTKQIEVKPNAKYHKKHAEALKELRSIMAVAADKGPGQNLLLQLEFQEVIESIREIYQ